MFVELAVLAGHEAGAAQVVRMIVEQLLARGDLDDLAAAMTAAAA